MLLSPPFLPVPQPGETDDQFIPRAMAAGQPGAGAFPISFELNWHGGLHLTAPQDDQNTPLAVRAMADGTVVFLRSPTQQNADMKHPLNYLGGWSDDGCVVIRHETEVGIQQAAGVATSVVFYSIYQHLNAVDPGLQQGSAIYRKDRIGTAGQIYGAANKIHFEIICDDANVEHLTGRNTTYNHITADGRTDAVFGTLYFLLLLNTQFFANDPLAATAPPQVVYTNSQEAHFVGMQFVKGDCVMETRHLDGRTLGTPVREAKYEYKLYSEAARLYPHGPSAGLELLRFGRVLGPDALNPPNSPLWRKVPTPTGQGWVNLNAPNVRKFSDADFPMWDGWWMLVDGSASVDSRCREFAILDLLVQRDDKQQNTAKGLLNLTPQQAQQALADPAIQAKLSRKICKFPTHWDASTIDSRFGWLRTDPRYRMTQTDFARFKAHVTALCFWQQANLGLGTTPWHFHPTAFLSQFRKCCWLSQKELAQCIPRRQLSLVHANFVAGAVANWQTALARSTSWKTPINLAARKYLVSSTPQRWMHFLAQVLAESGFFHFVKEIGGENASYAPYFGRGLIQLTHEGNYRFYGNYRQFLLSHPNPAPPFTALGWSPNDLIATSNTVFNPDNCADSATFFWTCAQLNAIHTDGLEVSDTGAALHDVVQASKLTNGNVSVQNINGLEVRIENFFFLKYVLLDFLPPQNNAENVTFEWRDSSDKTVPAPTPANPNRMVFGHANHTINIPLNPQRP